MEIAVYWNQEVLTMNYWMKKLGELLLQMNGI